MEKINQFLKSCLNWLKNLTNNVKEDLVKVKNFISWPVWYIIISSVGMFFIAVQAVGEWFGFVCPSVGLIVYLVKKGNKKIKQ